MGPQRLRLLSRERHLLDFGVHSGCVKNRCLHPTGPRDQTMARSDSRVGSRPSIEELLLSLSKSLHKRWNTAELSATLGLSNSQLRRVFVAHTGHPPMRYLRNLRLEAARELLGGSRVSVKKAAAAVGFSDLSHFVRAFREHHGKPPSECRGERYRKIC